MNNNSKTPENQTYTANTKLYLIRFEDKHDINIIILLDIDQVHGYDDISSRILKIYDTAIVEPLMIIFNICIVKSTFPDT